ncbi:ferredoxin [Paenibacillus swuensis]|uniref:Ferredoxin n=1 Tax=Paenibacillus swuensis TaxID=1178515 RepID=A0A172TLS7_9BACL|nr:2Fe-2S iron-sulfur cluster-binding protein [Paenibacillus swuensis]ANE47980.1 ferredoxin [Paenibacillus swuensis]
MLVEVTFLPEGRKAQVRPGTTLLDAARKARVNIRTRCGGKAGCLMCKVTVEDGIGVAGMNHNEALKLGTLAETGQRLACQAKVTGACVANVPEDPLKAAVRAQLLRQQQEDEW